MIKRQFIILEILNSQNPILIPLINDEIKSKIIGRQGNNIKTFIKNSEVDVIIDDTPKVVKIFSFDVLKKEIAAHALKEIINKNYFSPSKIEETIIKSKKNTFYIVEEIGKKSVKELGLNNISNA